MVLYAATWSDVVEVAEDVGKVAVALVVAAGLVWRVAVKPHLTRFVAENRANQAEALEQLTAEKDPDTLAGRAAQLPRLLARVERLEDQKLDYRLGIVEVGQRNHDDRLGNLESVLLRDLAGQLRSERAETRAWDPLARADQDRADRIRDRVRRERGETP